MKKLFNKKVIFLVLILIIIGGYFFTNSSNNFVTLSYKEIESSNFLKTLNIDGTFEPVESVEILVPVNKKIVEIFHKENDLIKKDQIIAKLDGKNLDVALKKLKVKKTQLLKDISDLRNNSSKDQLNILKNNIKRSDLNIENTKSKLEKLTRDLANKEDLYYNTQIDYSEYEDFKLKFQDTELLLENNILELKRNQSLLSDYYSNEKDSIYYKEKEVEIIDLDIEDINNKIDDLYIKSSIDGTIVDFNLKLDEFVTKENSSILVYDISDLILNCKLLQDEVIGLKLGMVAKVTSKGTNEEFQGKIIEIKKIATLDKNTQGGEPKTVVKIKFDNKSADIISGFEGDAKIVLDNSANSLIASKESVVSKNNEKFIYTVKNGKVVEIKINVIDENLDDYIISNDGLKDMEYISNPYEGITPGQIVKENIINLGGV